MKIYNNGFFFDDLVFCKKAVMHNHLKKVGKVFHGIFLSLLQVILLFSYLPENVNFFT